MPGPNPTPPPEESSEERDARVTAENEQRDALRRELLDLQEQVNAARVHGYADLSAEEAAAVLVDETVKAGKSPTVADHLDAMAKARPARNDEPAGE